MEIAKAFVALAPTTDGFGKATEKQVGGELGRSGKKVGGLFGTGIAAGTAAAIGGGAAVLGFLKSANEEARDAQKVGALTTSTIKATGSAAGVTAKQVGDLAGALSSKTGIDDEVIQSGQNMLLTFKNIRNEAGKGNDIFNQSSAALIDMASAMGTEPKQAAIQLGKALNDPIKGVSALGRVGVTFTEGQKEQIKTLVETGRTMDAQKIILKELNSQFGGAAEAQATAGDKARVAWGNLQETVGTALLPLWDRILAGGTSVMLFLTNNIGPAIAKIGSFIEPVKTAISGLFNSAGGTSGLMTALSSIVATLRANVLPILLSARDTFVNVLLPAIMRVGAYLLANLMPIFRQVWSIISTQVLPIITSLAVFFYSTLYPAIIRVVSAVIANLKPVLDQLFATIQGTILPVLQRLLAKFQEHLPTIKRVIAVVVNIIGWVLRLAAAILGKVLPPLIRFAGFLIKNVVSAVSTVIGWVVQIIGHVVGFGSAVINAVGKVGEFVTGVRAKFGEAVEFMKGIPGKALEAIGDIGGLLLQKGKDLIQGLIDGITSKIKALKDKMGEIAGAIGGFLPGSPIKEGPLVSWNKGGAGKRLMDMLALGITAEPVRAAMNTALRPVSIPRPAGLALADGSASVGSSGGSGRPIIVNDSGDPHRTAQEVVRIESFEGVA